MGNSFLIRNSTIVNEGKSFQGDVLIENGIIAEVIPNSGQTPPYPPLEKKGEPYPKPGDQSQSGGLTTINALGLFLLPGIIDDQVHFRDPGLTQKGDLHTETRAAVAGGVTSFMDMPNTTPKAVTLEVLVEKYRIASEKSLANYSFFLGATNDNLDEIRKADPRTICGVKVFMGASTGNMLVDDPAALEAIFAGSKMIVAIHSEDEGIIRANLQRYKEIYGDDIPAEAHPLIRSAEACLRSTERAVSLARKHNTRLHVLHLSTAAEAALLDAPGPLENKRITGEVCVHHIWFDDRDYARLGALIKWNPAIKSEAEKNGLFKALLEDRIDLVATDHAPHLLEEKSNPYTTCPSGAPLIQHSLHMMLEFWRQGRIPLETIVAKMCHNPAILYRIVDRGFIREGYAADLVLVDPNRPWTVSKENILYKCGWSPVDGVTFTSTVTHTFVNGHPVYVNGIFDETVKGRRLLFNL
jgi:dihydroorotase